MMMIRKCVSLVCAVVFLAGFFRVPLALAAGEEVNQAILYFNAMEYRKAEPLFLELLESGDFREFHRLETRLYLARIYVAMQQKEKAIEQYKLILALEPDYSPPPDASPTIREAFELACAQAQPPGWTPSVTTHAKPGRGGKALGRMLVGIGVISLATGVVSYQLAGEQHKKLTETEDDPETAEEAEDAREAGRRWENIAWSCLAIGTVSTGAGIYILASPSSGKAANRSDYRLLTGAATTGAEHSVVFGIIW